MNICIKIYNKGNNINLLYARSPGAFSLYPIKSRQVVPRHSLLPSVVPATIFDDVHVAVLAFFKPICDMRFQFRNSFRFRST